MPLPPVLAEVTESAAQVAERLLRAVNDRAAFRLQPGASVGVGWQRRATGDGRGLVQMADEAMHRVKAAGGDGFGVLTTRQSPG